MSPKGDFPAGLNPDGSMRDPDANDGLEIGAFGFKFKLTGHLAKQATMALAGGAVLWYIGINEPQQILKEMHVLHQDLLVSTVTSQAIVESLPSKQQEQAKKMIKDRVAVLQLAEAR